MPRSLERRVSQLMSSPAITVHPDASIRDAIRIIGRRRIGSLIVTAPGRLLGILTERNLLERVLYPELDPARTTVQHAMSRRVTTVSPEDSVKEAAERMLKGDLRLVVQEESDVIGVVTASDIVRALSGARIMHSRVGDFMVKRVLTLPEDASVRQALRSMVEEGIGSVIICRDGAPYGIFAERDLMTKVLARQIPLETGVGRLASHPLIYASPSTTIQKAAKLMVANKIRRLLIFEGGELVGIVTGRDLVREIGNLTVA